MIAQEVAASKSEDEAKIKEVDGEASDALSKVLNEMPQSDNNDEPQKAAASGEVPVPTSSKLNVAGF